MSEPTIIIAGITRSGLSLTMQMLDAGGFPVQGEYPSYEPFDIGTIPWDKCHGTSVKMVDTQHQIPPDGRYWVIRLRRNMTEQSRSFNKWISALFHAKSIPPSKLVESFKRDYAVIDAWAVQQEKLLVLDFENIINKPEYVARVLSEFVVKRLNENAMVQTVMPRSPECYPGLLEIQLIERKSA